MSATSLSRTGIKFVLCNHLALAMNLVWNMQHKLTGVDTVVNSTCMPNDLVKTSILLADISQVILSEISRWNLMEDMIAQSTPIITIDK